MIGIVGNGFVGNAVYQNLRDKVRCKVFDVDKNRSLNTLGEVILQDFIFVCLPTPMKYGGECDLSILDNFFKDLPDHLTGTFVIKSTVPVGTTKKLNQKYQENTTLFKRFCTKHIKAPCFSLLFKSRLATAAGHSLGLELGLPAAEQFEKVLKTLWFSILFMEKCEQHYVFH